MVFARLSKAFGWTPNEISSLTPSQITLYLDALIQLEFEDFQYKEVHRGVKVKEHQRPQRKYLPEEEIPSLSEEEKNKDKEFTKWWMEKVTKGHSWPSRSN